MIQFLIVYCLNLTLRLSGSIISLLLIYISRKTKLIKQGSLLLVHMLIVYDLLNFVLGSLHTIFLIANWNYDGVDYDPVLFFFTNIPMLVHTKGEIILLIGIALDRLLAVFIPTYYKYLNHKAKAAVIFLIAICFGLGDMTLFVLLSGIKHRPNCGALMCFMDAQNKKIMGLSNAILGVILLILTIIFLIRLKKLADLQPEERSSDRNRFSRANKMALISLTCSGMLCIVPSVFVGAMDDVSDALFKRIGPVLSSLFLSAGILNSLALLLRNTEMKRELRSLWLKNSVIPVDNGSIQTRKPEVVITMAQ